MIKKLLLLTGTLFGLFAVSIIILRITGYWSAYKMPTPANEPGLKVGQLVLVTKFIKPQGYSFITFKSAYKDSLTAAMGIETDNATYVHRLCGMPGDELIMKNGVLFVNNKNFDSTIDLKQQYRISKKDAEKINSADFADNEFMPVDYTGKTNDALITLDRESFKKYSLLVKLIPFYITDTSSTTGGFKWLDKNSTWTVDNFGPLLVPQGNYFMLGDNRHNALDSRYTGFVSIKDITGVVFRKF